MNLDKQPQLCIGITYNATTIKQCESARKCIESNPGISDALKMEGN